MAFAVGVFLGMSPLLGLHTILGLAFSWLFRFNKVVTITGVFITNPWTIIPIYSLGTWIGAKCLGFSEIIPDIDWSNISLALLIKDFKPLLMPFFLGNFILGFASAIISYFIIYFAAKKMRGNVR